MEWFRALDSYRSEGLPGGLFLTEGLRDRDAED